MVVFGIDGILGRANEPRTQIFSPPTTTPPPPSHFIWALLLSFLSFSWEYFSQPKYFKPLLGLSVSSQRLGPCHIGPNHLAVLQGINYFKVRAFSPNPTAGLQRFFPVMMMMVAELFS